MNTNKKKQIIIQGIPFSENLSDSQPRDDHDSGNTDNTVAYGYKSLTITKDGITTPLSKDDDKFISHGATFEEARQTFWIRWSIFSKRAFGRTYIPIYK